ncbi:hypothetical protein JOF56_006981 [Kibdelosporangium banguiense]|uniref:MucB/RseB N-terminal domain-containing protein n=1 Tax=Kibdelosporangium banguiense TaxID=1365924 RepID=A0ABS4TQB1_9PSEU|nr:hypothetical protein [Kibdelosporangium banguiense]MBP2326596.1 hypothetical protein [Kibdelosporangium banguiense]
MPTEQEYGQELGTRLRHELQDVRASPDLARKLRRRQAKRAWTIRTAIAVPATVVAVAAVMVATTTTVQKSPSEAVNNPPPVENVPVENVAQVQAQTIKAVSQAPQYVIQSKSTYAGGYYDEWVDKATQRYRNDVYNRSSGVSVPSSDRKMTLPAGPDTGPPAPIHLNQSHAVSGPDGDQDMVTVDYDLKTWSTDHMTDRKPTDIPDITDADSVRKAISDGTLELVGKENIDGIDTLRLRLYGPDRSYRIDMWVDGKTYLPVRNIATKGTGEPGDKEFPASAATTTTYKWLPRTEENLARLVLIPPPGFKKTK